MRFINKCHNFNMEQCVSYSLTDDCDLLINAMTLKWNNIFHIHLYAIC